MTKQEKAQDLIKLFGEDGHGYAILSHRMAVQAALKCVREILEQRKSIDDVGQDHAGFTAKELYGQYWNGVKLEIEKQL